MKIKRGLAGAAAIAVFLATSSALAAPKAAAGDKKDAQNNDQVMDFKDDPLEAGGLGPNEVGLKIRQGPVRSTLIKPRMSFIPELRASVENL